DLCHTAGGMKARWTAWLAALLVMSATLGLPVTRAANNSVCCYQVYCERKKQPAAEASEAPARIPPASPEFSPAPPRDALRAALLDFSLFQRPPPAAPTARL